MIGTSFAGKRSTRRRRAAAGALSAAAVIVLAACSSSAPSSGSGTAASGGSTNNTFIMQTAPGSVLPYIGYIAQQQGFFKKHNVNVKFATLTTGLSSTAALNAGSLDVITADPASTGPLLAKGGNLEMISGEDTMQWQVLVPASEAGKPFAQVIKNIKVMGAPAAAGGTAALTVLMEKAYGISPGSIKVVADQSGAGVVSGSEQGIIVSPAFSCVLEDKDNLKPAFTFSKAMESSYPAPLSTAIGIPDVAFWSLKSWVQKNPTLVKNVQAALSEAIAWVNSPANLDAWVSAMRSGPLNNTSLSDSQYKSCLSGVQGLFSPNFSAANAQTWNQLVKDMNVLPAGLPPTTQWLNSNVPS
jgi:ABC-type nitrate/sulfonate/bicarbonate transport system substrate-binding protein